MYFPLKMRMFQLVILVFRGVLSNKSILSKSTFVLRLVLFQMVVVGICSPRKVGDKDAKPIFVVTNRCVLFKLAGRKPRPPARFFEKIVYVCFEVMFTFCNFLSWDSSPVGRTW